MWARVLSSSWLQVSVALPLTKQQFSNVTLYVFIVEFLVMFVSLDLCNGITVSNNLQNKLDMVIFLGHLNKTMVASTLALRYPLCKLCSVATGGAKQELMSVLGFSSENMLSTCYSKLQPVVSTMKDINFISFDKIFVNFTDDINATFIANPVNYGVQVNKVGFHFPAAAASFINRWVDTTTLKRISKVIDAKEIDKNMSILIINAAYLKVTWEFPFDIRLTKSNKFHRVDGNVSIVPMMTKTDQYSYLNDANTNLQFINTNLASFGLSITFGIPDSIRGLAGFLHKLSNEPDYLRSVYTRMRVEPVTLRIPKFKIKSHFDVEHFLKQIGLNLIFNKTNSGLNSILKQNGRTKNVYVSKAKQTYFLDVDEMGIFRRPIEQEHRSGKFREDFSPKSKEVVADRPFYFSINLQEDIANRFVQTRLITGVYYGPE